MRLAVVAASGLRTTVHLRNREDLAADLAYCAEQDRRQREPLEREQRAREEAELQRLIDKHGLEAVETILAGSGRAVPASLRGARR